MGKDVCVLYAGLHCEELKEKDNKIFALQEFVKLVAEMHPDSNPLPFIKKAQEFVQKIHPLFEQILNSFASHPAPASQEGVEEAAKAYAQKGWNESGVTDESELTFKGIALIQMATEDFKSGATWQSSKPTEGCRWVSIRDRLPENGQVLGCMEDTRSIYVCYYHRNKGFQVWGLGREQPITDMKVTHWMPLPPNPDESSLPQTGQEQEDNDKANKPWPYNTAGHDETYG